VQDQLACLAAAIRDGAVADGADDHERPCAAPDREEDAVVADAGRPEATQAADELLAGALGICLDRAERLDDRFLDGAREGGEIAAGAAGEPKLSQARGRA